MAINKTLHKLAVLQKTINFKCIFLTSSFFLAMLYQYDILHPFQVSKIYKQKIFN